MEIETWNAVAENCNRFLSKGRKVLLEGRLASSSWKTKDGENRTKIYCVAEKVTFLDKSSEANDKQQEDQNKDEELDEFADVPF
jgi:single-strand DNA-binding protein